MERIQSPIPATDDAIEQEIVRKGKTAARITPADIEASIASTHYFTAAEAVMGASYASHLANRSEDSDGTFGWQEPPELTLLTFCVLVLRNGFTATGESACASPENFDAEIGQKVARENAKQKLWPLLGYNLKDRLHEAELKADPVLKYERHEHGYTNLVADKAA